MPNGPYAGVLEYLRRVVAPRDAPAVPDMELLAHFAHRASL
jgi:hypothetical protein